MTNTDLNKKMHTFMGECYHESELTGYDEEADEYEYECTKCGHETASLSSNAGKHGANKNYPENISDAWMLVEKVMKEQSYNKKKQFTDELKFIFYNTHPATAICLAVEKVMEG